jgi:hypothetical protein
MRMDRKYLAILAASTAARNSLSGLLVAAVGGPQVLGDLGGEHSCKKFTFGTASCGSRLKLRLKGDNTACEAKG